MALLRLSNELDDNKHSNIGAVGGAQLWGEVKDGGVGAEGSHWAAFYDDSAFHHHRNQIDGRYWYGQRTEEHSRFEDYRFDGLALSDAFLGNYFSQVSISFTQHKSS